MLSKICFAVPLLVHLGHGSGFVVAPAFVLKQMTTITDPLQLESYYGGPQAFLLVVMLFRLAGLFEVLVALGVLLLGDSKMGHMIMLVFGVVSMLALATSTEAAFGVASTVLEGSSAMPQGHRDGLKIGIVSNTVTTALPFLGAMVTDGTNKGSLSRAASVPSRLLLLFYSLVLGGAALGLLAWPQTWLSVTNEWFTAGKPLVQSSLGAVLQVLTARQLASAALPFAMLLSLLKPAKRALTLVMLFWLGFVHVGYTLLAGFPHRAAELQQVMGLCGVMMVIVFAVYMSLPKATKKDE